MQNITNPQATPQAENLDGSAIASPAPEASAPEISPLPWKQSGYKIEDAAGDYIAEGLIRADARFIVQAANSHDALVKALTHAMTLLPPCKCQDNEDGFKLCESCHVNDKGNAALRLALPAPSSTEARK